MSSLLPALFLACILAVSGVAKLRDPAAAAAGFRALRVPAPLTRPWVVAALPWVEIALAVGLVVAPGALFLAVAAAVAVLFAVYLTLVGRVVLTGQEADCGCFGSLTTGRVTAWTLARNVGLVALAALTLWAATALPDAVITRLFTVDAAGWGLLAVSGAVALTAALSAYEPPAPPAAEVTTVAPTASEDDLEDYLRTPIPYGFLDTAAGDKVHLHDLVRTRAALLVFVSLGCGGCSQTLQELPGWVDRSPLLAVHTVADGVHVLEQQYPHLLDSALGDAGGQVKQLLRIAGSPAAVLLGADRMLAGGPVVGSNNVHDFVEEIFEQLAEVEAAQQAMLSAEAADA